MNLLEKIEFLMLQNHLSRRQLSIQSGIPYSTLDNWWKRGSTSMSLSTFTILCEFFGVTMESMVYDDRDIEYTKDMAGEISGDESVLLSGFRAASKQIRDTLLLIARQEILKLRDQLKMPPEYRKV